MYINRTRNNGQNLNPIPFHQNTKKQFGFLLTEVKYYKILPTEVLQSPSA